MYLSKRLSREIIEGSGYRTGLFPFQSLACKQLPTAVATPAAKNERREYDELLMDGNLPEHGLERQNQLPTAYAVSRTPQRGHTDQQSGLELHASPYTVHVTGIRYRVEGD